MSRPTNRMRLFLVVLLLCESNQIGVIMGPYEIVVEELSNCGSEEGGRIIPFEVNPYFVKDDGERKQFFKGNISFSFTRDEFYALNVNNTFYMKKNNDFLFMYKYEGNLCQAAFNYSKELYNKFLERLGLEHDECAIKPGNYSIEGWSPVPDLPAPMLEYGTYKVVMKCLLNSEVVGCLQAVGVVKPKP